MSTTTFKRIVKMSFAPDKAAEFLAVFEESKSHIRAFPGCLHLELLRGRTKPNLFFTYSFWESEEALEAYRHSDLFRATWAKTKVLFNDKPEAWSVDMLDLIPEQIK